MPTTAGLPLFRYLPVVTRALSTSAIVVAIMSLPESAFFDYTCDTCGASICERLQIMNLTLDYVDDLYCLDCLAKEQDLPPPEMAEFAKAYVHARECFKTPWDAFAPKAVQCPRIATGQCFCQD
jgi:hypothetical protein